VESERFDRLAQMVSKAASRRSALRGLARGAFGGIGLAGASALVVDEETALAKKCNGNAQCKNPKNPCKKGVCRGGKCRKKNKRNGKSCGEDRVCVNGSCVAGCASTGDACSANDECCSAVCACGDPTGWATKPDDDTCWPENYSQGFEQNLDGWYDFRNQFAPTDPQNRVFSPQETIQRVCGPQNGIPASSGDCFAQVRAGIAYPPIEDLTALTTFAGFSNVMPEDGFRASIDIYLDAAAAEEEQRFAYTVAMNETTCEWGGDYIFHVGKVGGQFCVRGGTDLDTIAGPAPCATVLGMEPVVLGADAKGWYTFAHAFQRVGGVVEVAMALFDPDGNAVDGWEPDPVIPTAAGGNRYGWFPWNDFDDLPIDEVSRTSSASL
jgi:hypothetical protein